MAAPVKCPKGHWFNPVVFGNACPVCKTKDARSEKPLSEDDVLAILDTPSEAAAEQTDTEKDPHGSSLHRRKKICPACSFETSFSFGHCPRCGGPLSVASIKVT